jgi:prepilin-type N-terminal cleavage/methylation domain-containing protein
MRIYRQEHIDTHGFTLLEIMVSIFIFSIIITTILVSYQSVFFKADKIDAGMDLYTMASSCLNRLSVDIGGIAISLAPRYRKPETDAEPDPYRLVGDVSNAITGSFSRLRFASRSHAGLDGTAKTGITEIVYYVDEDRDGISALRRRDRLYPFEYSEEEAQEPVVCEYVKSLAFTYYDADGEIYESWESESLDHGYATPVAIQVKLEIGRTESESLVFDTMLKLPVRREAIE